MCLIHYGNGVPWKISETSKQLADSISIKMFVGCQNLELARNGPEGAQSVGRNGAVNSRKNIAD